MKYLLTFALASLFLAPTWVAAADPVPTPTDDAGQSLQHPASAGELNQALQGETTASVPDSRDQASFFIFLGSIVLSLLVFGALQRRRPRADGVGRKKRL